jgi:hypothetical protein
MRPLDQTCQPISQISGHPPMHRRPMGPSDAATTVTSASCDPSNPSAIPPPRPAPRPVGVGGVEVGPVPAQVAGVHVDQAGHVQRDGDRRLPDEFQPHGNPNAIMARNGLDADGIAASVLDYLG